MITKTRTAVLLILIALLTASLGNAMSPEAAAVAAPNEYASSLYTSELFEFSYLWREIASLTVAEHGEWMMLDRNSEEWLLYTLDYLEQFLVEIDRWLEDFGISESDEADSPVVLLNELREGTSSVIIYLDTGRYELGADLLASLSRTADRLSHRFGDYDY
ncbi:hypothetical protein K8R78_02010 [bacterium]|nr:hypothetical protein [bacterium]